MQNKTINKIVLSASLVAATFVAGCSVGKAPVEPTGNTVQNGLVRERDEG
jgi:outer membrane murein-binding lipoprotein Lpp